MDPVAFTCYNFAYLISFLSTSPFVHGYTDDSHIYLSFRSYSSHSEINAVSAIENCIAGIRSYSILLILY